MEKWWGKVALVTGASSGIGKAIVESLVRNGMKVIGCARNLPALKEIESTLNTAGPGEMTAIRCDVAVEEEILDMFKKIEEKYGALHVCVSNAGLALNASVLTGSVENWRSMLNVNVVGLSICTREAVKMMEKHGINDGHVIHMGSVYGYIIPENPIAHFYCATKFAVRALTEGLRQELREKKSHIRVTSISPGRVQTEIVDRAFPNNPEIAESMYSAFETLQPEDIAGAVTYALGAPLRVDVNDIIVRPTEEK